MAAMPTWILRAILGCCIASLALNSVVAWIVVSHTRGAVVAAPHPAAATGAGAGTATPQGAAAEAAPVPRPAPPREPFQRDWEFVDKASGRRIGAVILDDAGRLEEFVRAARLEPAQEVALRDRYAERRVREMQAAREMVKQGAWRSEEFRKLQRRFWADEYRALPPAQAAHLPPSFIPVE